MKILILFLLFCPIIPSTYAQTIQLQISDGKEGIPYANVSILHTTDRAVSNIQGYFKLQTTSDQSKDTVAISCVGFNTKKILVRDLIKLANESNEIALDEAEIRLPEFVFTGQELKEKLLGNPRAGKTLQAGFSRVGPGDQLGTIIKIRKSPTVIKSFHMRVTFIDNDSMKLRLNFYAIKNGLPDTKLPYDNIFIASASLFAGDFSLDLSDHDLVVEEDFCVTIECIENLDSVSHLGFGLSLVNGNAIGRLEEDSEWTKLGMLGLGFWVTALY